MRYNIQTILEFVKTRVANISGLSLIVNIVLIILPFHIPFSMVIRALLNMFKVIFSSLLSFHVVSWVPDQVVAGIFGLEVVSVHDNNRHCDERIFLIQIFKGG